MQLTNEAFRAVVENRGDVPRSSRRMVMVGSLYEMRSRILCIGLAAQELGWYWNG